MATRPRNTTISGRQLQLDQQLLPVPDRREQGAGSREQGIVITALIRATT
ncbi:unnamed protein product, partial [Musa acuminata subsp. malaccensis]